MDEHKDGLTIFLKTPEAKAIPERATTAHEKYIILQNDVLQAESRSLREQISRNEHQIDELECGSDRQERSTTYMKGLLKNFIELDNMRAKIVDIETAIAKKTQKDARAYRTEAVRDFRTAEVIMILYVSACCAILSASSSIPVFFVVFATIYLQERVMTRTIVPACTEERLKIKELLAEIKKVTDAQDFLHETIDSL